MPATIIMGGQWGDEGKGKLTDALASQASMVVRANGGSNAGHTVKTDKGTFKLHLTPSGILNEDVTCVIGAGVVIDLETLSRELSELAERGIDTSRLRISDRAHLVLPYHSKLSRNHQVGVGLASGKSLPDVLAGMTEVAEGVDTTRAAVEMAREAGVEMPIAEQMYEILFAGKSPVDAVQALMVREPRRENI